MAETQSDRGLSQRARVSAAGAELEGDLGLPPTPWGLVVLPHGSGSSHGPRDSFIAEKLREAGLATLLVQLLTHEEVVLDARKACFRFDISLLAARLAGATDWLAEQPTTRGLAIGYFVASTETAAALVVAAERPGTIGAIVSREGRPDLAGSVLERVLTPTLLIVGGNDEEVIGLNRTALRKLRCPVKEFTLVPGASHLYEEPGVQEEVTRLATGWFTTHLSAAR